MLPNAATSKDYSLTPVKDLASMAKFCGQVAAIYDDYVDPDGEQLEDVGSIKLTIASCGTPHLVISTLEINDQDAFEAMQRELSRQAARVGQGYGVSSAYPQGRRIWDDNTLRWTDDGAKGYGAKKTAPWPRQKSFTAEDPGQPGTIGELNERLAEEMDQYAEKETLLAQEQNDRHVQEAVERWEDDGGDVEKLVSDIPESVA